MAWRWGFLLLLLLLIGLVTFQIEIWPTPTAKPIQVGDNPVPTPPVFVAEDNRAIRNADQVQREKIADRKNELGLATQQQLLAIGKKVDGISLLDGRDLEPLRQEAAILAVEDPEGFRQFILSMVQELGTTSTATAFFFLETFIALEPAPGAIISQILKSGGAAEPTSGTNQADLVKVFVLESLFKRQDKGPKFGDNPLPMVEVDLVGIAKNGENLNLVREALLLLKGYFQYTPEQLQLLIVNQPENNQSALADIIN